MERNRIELPYDSDAERALTRVTLLRAGVPRRVLDVHLPLTRPATADEPRNGKKPSSIRVG